MSSETPNVSVIMPCYNEEAFIAGAVESLTDDFVLGHGEILVVDGMSSDNTVAVVRDLMKGNPTIQLLSNPERLQCFALNRGIKAARGEIIVRVDAHSRYPKGYVKQLADLLESTGAANVGGVMVPKGNSTVQQAIALAMSHPVGVGDARFHLGNYRGTVDTVYLGTFRKSLFSEIGDYDTNCRTNEDAELNIRILERGHTIFLDSAIRVEYHPRDSLAKLARQYFLYGRGRAYTTLKHRRFTSFRQWAPPLLVLALAFTAAAALVEPLFLLFWAVYAAAVTGAVLATGHKKQSTDKNKENVSQDKVSLCMRLLTATAIMIMHTTWGTGFLEFFLRRPFKRSRKTTKNGEK